jgi:imidazole glycerol phosphate synthase glutamine amidotransferase subunit
MIAILDYGAGNVGSVLKAVQHLGYPALPIDRPELLNGSEKFILPGQGHFGAMIQALDDRRMLAGLRKRLATGKPYLGICLGLQVLFEASAEAPDIPGLGLLPGRVRRFEGVAKVPQVGWNQLQIRRSGRLLKNIPDGSFVYYCHSYYAPVTEEAVDVSEYGQTYATAIEIDNIWAVQFHPEKSGEVGLKVLKNFLDS